MRTPNLSTKTNGRPPTAFSPPSDRGLLFHLACNPQSKSKTRATTATILHYIVLSALGLCVSTEAKAGELIGEVPFSVSINTRTTCDATIPSLDFDFVNLTPGQPESQKKLITVWCSGRQKVLFNTLWDGALLRGDVKTYENGDTLRVNYCYEAGTPCYGYTGNDFNMDVPPRTLMLKLTYTATASEAPLTRSGALLLSYP